MTVLHVSEYLAGDSWAWKMHDPGQHIGRIIAMSGGPYEVSVLRTMAAHYRPGTACIDVGAHVGNHALYMAAVRSAAVIAVEASPTNYGRLLANLTLNPTLRPFVVPHNVALGAATGQASFHDAPQDDITWGKAPALPDDAGSISMVTLDSLVPEDVEVSVVKVDVEGGEPDVIAGAVSTLSRCRPVVFLEAQDDEAATRNSHAMHFDSTYRLAATMNRRRTPVQVWVPR